MRAGLAGLSPEVGRLEPNADASRSLEPEACQTAPPANPGWLGWLGGLDC